MKKFAIIGGAFNPVTKAHVERTARLADFIYPGTRSLFDIMEVDGEKRDPVGKKETFAARKSSKATWIFV